MDSLEDPDELPENEDRMGTVWVSGGVLKGFKEPNGRLGAIHPLLSWLGSQLS